MAQFAFALLTGAVIGSLLALLAFGIVLTYRATGIFNFAQGALGMLFAFVFYQLTQGGTVTFVFLDYDQTWTLPTWVAVALVVGLLAPATGVLLDRMMFRKLRTAETHVQIVSTIGLLIAISGLAALVWSGSTSLTPREIFPTDLIRLGTFATPVSRFWIIAVTVGLSAGLLAFLRYSTLGVKMRAVVDRLDLAELVGIDSARVSSLAWALSTSFAALAGILIAPVQGASLDTTKLALLVIPATAAAVVGRLHHLPWTLAGAVAIGIGQTFSQSYAGQTVGPVLQSSLPFLVLFGALLLPIDWHEVRAEARPATALVDRQRVSRAVLVRRAVITLGVLLVLPHLPFLSQLEFQFAFAQVPAFALVFLGLVVLVGYAGQISLAHAALAGVGAIVAARLTAAGIPFLASVLLGGAAAVVPGVLLAWRAVRLPPLFLGLATLAFAALFEQLMVNVPALTNGLNGVRFERTAILDEPYAYYLAGLVLFGLAALLVRNIQNGSIGLGLAAMRDSEMASAGFGQSLARLKLVVFSLSAFLAGVGGAWYAGSIGVAEPTRFFTFFSLLALALAVVGGIRYRSGALLGAGLLVMMEPIVTRGLENLSGALDGSVAFYNITALPQMLFGIAAIQLATHPGGIVEQTRAGLADFRERRAPGGGAPPGDASVVEEVVTLEEPRVQPLARR